MLAPPPHILWLKPTDLSVMVGNRMSPTARASAAARPAQERAVATRRRILEATLGCLLDDGYARTSLPRVAARAGVSRGALSHHFPTRHDLISAALEHGFATRLTAMQDALPRERQPRDRLAAVLDALWSVVSGPAAAVWIELVNAARTDPALRRTLRRVSRRFNELADASLASALPATASPAERAAASALVFATLNGLALDDNVGINRDRVSLAREALPRAARAAASARRRS